MQVKVKIGSAYEPKWFEKRQTQGTYSGKNVPLDDDGMWLQNALIGKNATSFWKTRMLIAGLVILGCFVYLKMTGVL